MIVCIGDSLTHGQYLEDGETPWPALLRNFEVGAAGVPGDTTRLALERFPRDVQTILPDAVVMQFGHNDCNRWQSDRGLPRVSERAFRANLAEMVDRCRTFGAEPFLCTLTPSRKSLRHAEDTLAYDRAVREVATDMDVRLIDVRAIFDRDGLLLEDGVHLSAEGHRRIAAAVQAALEGWSRTRQSALTTSMLGDSGLPTGWGER